MIALLLAGVSWIFMPSEYRDTKPVVPVVEPLGPMPERHGWETRSLRAQGRSGGFYRWEYSKW